MKLLKISAVIFVVLATSVVPAAAVLIGPGGSSNVSGVASDPFSGLTPLASANYSFVSNAGPSDFSGTLTQDVYNVGGLIGFRYTVAANSTGGSAINRVTTSFFTGFSTDADFVQGTGTSQPPLSVNRQLSGSSVGFTWATNGGIAPGTTSPYLYVLTNATSYGLGGMTSFLNAGAASVSDWQPVPEPMSLLLLGSGMVVAGILGRRKDLFRPKGK